MLRKLLNCASRDASMSILPRSKANSNSSCSSETSWTPKQSREQNCPPQHDYPDDEERAPKPYRYTASGTDSLLFACPFAKGFPAKHRELRSCMTGWPSIARLKQHLTRCHSPRISCPRCCKPFKTERDLDSHIRAKKACLILPLPKRDETRMTASAQRDISRRIRKGENPERAWKHYYRILFPKVPQERIPSPYLDTTEDEISLARQDGALELWKRIHSTLPHIIEEETRGILLSGSSSELASRLLARISKSMGETLDTEEQGYGDKSFCSSASDIVIHEPPLNFSPQQISSSEIERLMASTSPLNFVADIHPESEAVQPSSTTSNMIETLQSHSNFSGASDLATSNWDTLNLCVDWVHEAQSLCTV